MGWSTDPNPQEVYPSVVGRPKLIGEDAITSEDIKDIMGYGVMSTPGVVINGKVVHAGGVPSRDKIEQWLNT